jgi:hypothetical protein
MLNLQTPILPLNPKESLLESSKHALLALDKEWKDSDYYVPSLDNQSPHFSARTEILSLAQMLARGGTYMNYAEVKWLVRELLHEHLHHYVPNDIKQRGRLFTQCPVRCDNPSLLELEQRTTNPYVRSLFATITALESMSAQKDKDGNTTALTAYKLLTSLRANPTSKESEHAMRLINHVAKELQISEKVQENLSSRPTLYAPTYSRELVTSALSTFTPTTNQPVLSDRVQYLIYLSVRQHYEHPTNNTPLALEEIPEYPFVISARHYVLDPTKDLFGIPKNHALLNTAPQHKATKRVDFDML